MNFRYLLFPILLLISVSTQGFGQGISFFEGTWKEALVKATDENKLIFVDAYATWCGPCKMMAKKVFTQEDVGEFFNDNFINMKLDMEKGESTEFRRKFSVSAFPTLFFVSGDNELIHKVVGAKQGPDLIDLGKQALKKNDQSGKYEEAYLAGDRSYDLVYAYVAALNHAEKPSSKIANEFLRSKPNITKAQKSAFLFEACQFVDSRLYKLMMTEKDEIIKVNSKEVFDQKILDIAWNTVNKGITYESFSLVEEGIEVVKNEHSSKGKVFKFEAPLEYYAKQKLKEEYKDISSKYFKKVAKKDAILLKGLVNQSIESFGKDGSIASYFIPFAERLVKLENSEMNYMILSKLLFNAGKKEAAVANMSKGIKTLKEKKEPTKQIERYLKILEKAS